ncbi:MAG TPA: hypothetical protein PLF40_00745 [Kofleriaceae bacterium]|nr:hypothetical protein [Kofleriaceae bacterium]
MTQRPPTSEPIPALRDGDDERDAVPEPDAAAGNSERMRAAQFAALLDDEVNGSPPPALALATRNQLETAIALRASAGRATLDDAAAAAMVASVLQEASVRGQPVGAVDELAAQRSKAQRRSSAARTPWLVAGGSMVVAAAAVLMLVLRPSPPTAPAAKPTVPLAWQSRPADPLIGVIERAEAGNAAARIDAIYADRLDGYRNALYAQAGVVQ